MTDIMKITNMLNGHLVMYVLSLYMYYY